MKLRKITLFILNPNWEILLLLFEMFQFSYIPRSEKVAQQHEKVHQQMLLLVKKLDFQKRDNKIRILGNYVATS